MDNNTTENLPLAGFSLPRCDLKIAFTVEYDLDGEICTVNINDYIANLPKSDRIKVLRELSSVITEAIMDEEF